MNSHVVKQSLLLNSFRSVLIVTALVATPYIAQAKILSSTPGQNSTNVPVTTNLVTVTDSAAVSAVYAQANLQKLLNGKYTNLKQLDFAPKVAGESQQQFEIPIPSGLLESGTTYRLQINGLAKVLSAGQLGTANLNENLIFTTAKKVVTTPPPTPTLSVTAAATPTSGTAPLTVNFTASDKVTGGLVVTGHSWNFGDGSATAMVQSSSHIYTAAGTYTATVTATSASTTATNTVTITVTAPPVTTPPVTTPPVTTPPVTTPPVTTSGCNGKTYDVGPGQALTTISQVPWFNLKAGDTVAVHYNGTSGYHEKIHTGASGTAACPITITGIPDPHTGAFPIIDGSNATTSVTAVLPASSGLEASSLIAVWSDNWAASGAVTVNYNIIQNLEIRNAKYTNTYIDENGAVKNYDEFSAGLYAVGVSHFIVQNCIFDGNGIGVMINSNGSFNSDNIVLRGNYIWNNGTLNDHEHQTYSEADNILIEGNYYGPMANGALGSQLKDRSAGTIIRYNHISVSPAGRALDLVDPEDNTVFARTPEFQNTWVYGNVIDQNGFSATSIHFGGDSEIAANYRPTLNFFNNTVRFMQNQSVAYHSSIFDVDGAGLLPTGSTADGNPVVNLANNIFYIAPATAGAAPTTLALWSGGKGTLNLVAPNALSFDPSDVGYYANGSSGWGLSDNYQTNPPGAPTLVNGNNLNVLAQGTNPFVNPTAGNFQLLPSSSLVGGGGPLPTVWGAYPAYYPVASGPGGALVPRAGNNIGAY